MNNKDKKNNPFSIAFGKEPYQYIGRLRYEDTVIHDFSGDHPAGQVYMLTGVRGAGKTVLLTEISKKLKRDKNWIVIDLNPERDLLQSFATQLCDNVDIYAELKKARINISIPGFSMDLEGEKPISDIEIVIRKLLEKANEKGKKVLVAIDEVTNTEYMRIFCAAFQILIRNELPVFLVMTGLYENINSLQNEKSLTFLHRAPKLKMTPLGISTMADRYESVFDIDRNTAVEMARLTKGYAYAFQVLGYLCWEKNTDYRSVMPEYGSYLDEYVYDKIWSELSRKDKQVLFGIANCESGRILEIRELLKLKNGEFNPYRKRLIQKGLINGDEHGYVRFTLPLFERYVLENYEEGLPVTDDTDHGDHAV
ncbi:MAG: AAA family ATPase [Lachnospiraceae bacterium]|nr:AAA family ATPase [Lachnospiraceae bacterium]